MKMIYFQTRVSLRVYFCSFVVLRLKRRRMFFLRNTPESIYNTFSIISCYFIVLFMAFA